MSAFVRLQKLLPQHPFSRATGALAASEAPWVSRPLIRAFAKAYDVDMSTAQRPRLADYRSFNDFFTRALVPGARPIAPSPRAIVSPADGAISQTGTIERGELLQAKGIGYSFRELANVCARPSFEGGAFATVYLSPSDYHRVHLPLAGRLVRTVAIPGKLFSVNAKTESEVDGLFAVNERLVCEFETEHGAMLVILVGALIVASIETRLGWPGLAVPPEARDPARPHVREGRGDRALSAGQQRRDVLRERAGGVGRGPRAGQDGAHGRAHRRGVAQPLAVCSREVNGAASGARGSARDGTLRIGVARYLCRPPIVLAVRVTIRDVASRAGVSISTVSRVLNDTCAVNEDKRKLVVDAAEALGYTPNPAARSLLGKRTGALGVLLPFLSGEFFSELLSGLDEAAQENDLFLLVSTSHRRSAEFQKAMQLLDKRVDGLIVMAPQLGDTGMASLLETDTPVVLLNTYADGITADVFNFDNFGGAHTLTRHFLDAGHKRIAHVRGPSHSGDARQRAEGYRTAMHEAGLDVLEIEGGYTRGEGVSAGEALAALQVLPTAIVAANDYCAMGILRAFREAGIDVPGRVAVGGFDGLASTQYTFPPLTTVRVPIADIGARAVHRLAARLHGDATPLQEHTIPVHLVTRESTEALALSR